MSRTKAYFVLLLTLRIAVPGYSQVYDLSSVLQNEIDPVYLQDLQVHALNNKGVALGSMASIHDPNSRRLFLIKARAGNFQVILLDEFAACSPQDLNDDNLILINAQLPNASTIQSLVLRPVKGAQPELVYGTKDQASLGHSIKGDQVTVNLAMDNLPDKSVDDENPYAYDGTFEIPTSASKGLLVSRTSGQAVPAGFPIASWYNLNSTITDVNAQGHYCGTSEGYTLGANRTSPYPYFATEDSVYRLLDGYQGTAIAMNDRDQVVGTWKHPITGNDYGFLYDQQLLQTSEYDWLDMLLAIPKAINLDGIVVGQAQDTAFVMIDQEYVSKASILPDLPETWKITNIIDINDQLEIIGTALAARKRILFFAKLSIPD